MSGSGNCWRKCSTCKKEIPLGAIYQVCSVSSCRKSVYCSVTCWDEHVPVMNHKSAWAEEREAPREAEGQQGIDRAPRRRIIVQNKSEGERIIGANSKDVPREVLIVASKLKNYIKDKHGFNTSNSVFDRLSDFVRFTVDDAVDNARAEGRKTLMDRDFR